MRTGVFGFTCRGGRQDSAWHPAGSMARVERGEPCSKAHLRVHNVRQVERLLHDGHEGLPEVRGDEHVGHGQQAVGAESLDQEQAVDGLPDGR